MLSQKEACYVKEEKDDYLKHLPAPVLSPQERYFAALSDSSLLNDDYMRAFFKIDALEENGYLCTRLILKLLTGVADLEIKELYCQADLQAPEGGHDIRPDVLIYDTEGTMYDLEFQQEGPREELVKRAHYDLGMLTARALPKGEPYVKLRDRMVVFVTAHDLFGDALPIHRFPPKIGSDGTAEGSGTIIFANASYKGDDEYGRLLHDIRCTNVEEMHEGPLKDLAAKLKKPFGKEKQAMSGVLKQLEEEWLQQGRQEGHQEGFEEGCIKTKSEGLLRTANVIRNIMKDKGWTLEEALTTFQLSQEDSRKVIALL